MYTGQLKHKSLVSANLVYNASMGFKSVKRSANQLIQSWPPETAEPKDISVDKQCGIGSKPYMSSLFIIHSVITS